MNLTFKYRLKDKRLARRLRAHAYAANQVWNWCVAQHRDTLDRYGAGAPRRRWLSSYDLQRQCNGAGAALGIHQKTVGSVCDQWAKDRSTRFRASFGSKRARGWVPFQRMARQIDGNSIVYLGQRFRFFGNKRRPLPDNAKGGAFVEDALGRWWICFHVEVEKRAADGSAIGIDLGLKDFAALSTGEKIEAQRFYRQSELALATAQRAAPRRSTRRRRTAGATFTTSFLHVSPANTRSLRLETSMQNGWRKREWQSPFTMPAGRLSAPCSLTRRRTTWKSAKHSRPKPVLRADHFRRSGRKVSQGLE